MNALSVQDDMTFDPTNKRLTMLRISLGALFGLVLALPFGFTDFVTFCHGLVNVNGNATSRLSDVALPAGQIAKQALMLLLPFVLGFSTSLVILVLNRLVDAVQSFVGKAGREEERPTGSQQTRTRRAGTRPKGEARS